MSFIHCFKHFHMKLWILIFGTEQVVEKLKSETEKHCRSKKAEAQVVVAENEGKSVQVFKHQQPLSKKSMFLDTACLFGCVMSVFSSLEKWNKRQHLNSKLKDFMILIWRMLR